MKNDLKSKLEESKKGENFVGFRLVQNIPIIYFPHGFEIIENNTDGKLCKENKKNIFLLMGVLKKFVSKNDGNISQNSKEKRYFPFFTAYELIKNYIENGYYSTQENKYTNARTGKIIWKETIKHCKPNFDGNNIVYNNFITRKIIVNKDTLIKKIHKKCVYNAFKKLAPFFGKLELEDEMIDIDKNKMEYINLLINERNNTFNEKNRKVLSLLIDYISKADFSNEGDVIEYGTYEFHAVWEKIIDSVLRCKNKKDYFPKGIINIMNTEDVILKPLREDSIYFNKKYCIIVDAKYYKYALSPFPFESLKNNDIYNLPGFSDINKQITYSEYVKKIHSKNDENDPDITDKNIFNFFVLPYSEKNVSNYLKNSDNLFGKKIHIRYIGYAKRMYSSEDKSYNKVYILLIDTKELIENYKKITKEDIDNFIDNFVKKNCI